MIPPAHGSPESLHLMVVNNIYPPFVAGGAERIVTYLCEGMARRGHRVTVVTTCGPEMEPYPTEIRNGVEVIRFFPPNLYWSFTRPSGPAARKWLWHIRDAWNMAAGRRLRDILIRNCPSILHSHVIDGFSAAIWARARAANVPVLHTAHDYHLLCPRAFLLTDEWRLCTRPRAHCLLYRRWHMQTTRHVALFASPSRFLLDLHQRAGAQADSYAVVPNGIPLPADGLRVRRHRSPESRTRFLLLCRLTIEKGVLVVLDALARLPQNLPIEVAIAGKGPLEEQVRAAAATDRRIHFLGYIDGEAKTAALERAGYLLLPSLWYENAPVAIIEAAAYGLGVIGSDIGAIPEFVEPNQTGLLFPPGDAARLATIMASVALTEDAMPDLAEKSAALARRFSQARMIDAYSSHYTALLGRTQGLAANG